MKNKTLAAWLAFLGGPLGLHRFYLFGLADLLGWLLPIPAALGLYGVLRARHYGLDDPWSWVLIPLLPPKRWARPCITCMPRIRCSIGPFRPRPRCLRTAA